MESMRGLSIILLSCSLWAADSKPGLDAETLFEMETISSPAISPDGKQIVFSRGWVDKVKDQLRSNLWIIDRDGRRLRELTTGPWRDSSPVWSPDGARIAFVSDRDGTSQIHVLWLDTREVAQLTRAPKSPSSLTWSPDGRQIAFTMTVPDEEPALSIKLPKRPEGAQWAKPAVVIDRLTWARDGVGPIPKGFTHVFTVDAVTGGTPRQWTDGKYNHGEPEWSADGKQLFISGIRKPDAEYLRNDSEIYAIDLTTGAIKALTSRVGPDGNPAVKGGWIAYTGFDDKKLTNTVSSIYLMKTDGTEQRLWAGALPSSPGRLQWDTEGRGVYYTMEERGSSNIYYLSVGGQPRKVSDGVHMIAQADFAKTGEVAAVRSSFHEPPALVMSSTRDMKTWRKLVDVNLDVLSQRQLGAVEEIWYESADGWKVQGWLVKPVNFDASKKYPLVLYIHGGPWSMYSVAFNWAWQNFAANGYAVLYTNPRGSTGYGQEFVSGIQYAYPGKDYDDLMAGVDAAMKKGFIDERNLFVCGGSGGGVLTAWIVGHTDRFRAAVSMRPVINWHSFVGTTDGPMWYDQFKKKPWEDPMEYAARSPLTYAGRVKTPTMVMTGEADLRTPMTQSEEYYRALKIQKKETLLVRVPEEFHGWRRPSHQLMQQLYLLAWFEKYRVKDAAKAGGE
ncbi:MAG: dipeptidyl aminopeptidase [Candidatus Solibacter sp.]|nr:dipeptidyl aminopeptidase [Candidatus Solibacter sp.]